MVDAAKVNVLSAMVNARHAAGGSQGGLLGGFDVRQLPTPLVRMASDRNGKLYFAT